MTIEWVNYLSEFSICEGLLYLNFQSAEIVLNERLRRLITCYINLADFKGTLNYQQCREVLNIGTRSVNEP